MESKVLQVFYGENRLPYKDISRTVHFPIIGSAFQGANNVDEIRFYFDQIGGTNTTWIAITKLPNGKILTKVLDTTLDIELNENYASLSLSSAYTQYKGDIYISLQGYQGGVVVEYDEESELYTINGTPTIQATGSIKLSVNYATQFIGSGEVDDITLQELLGYFATKLNINNGIVVINTTSADISGYDNGQVFYALTDKKFYQKLNDALVLFAEYTLKDYAEQTYVKKIVIDASLTMQDVYDAVGYDTPFLFSVDDTTYIGMLTTDINDNYLLEIWCDSGSWSLPYTYVEAFRNVLYNNKVIKVVAVPVVEIANAITTLSDEDYQKLTQDNSVIKYNGRLYTKSNIGSTTIEFVCADYDNNQVSDYRQIIKYSIFVNTSTKATNQLTSYLNIYDATQVDSIANTKLNKQTTPQTVYAVSPNGTQTQLGYSSGVSYSSLVLRDGAGRVIVPLTPTNNDEATSKKYVDDNIATLASALKYKGSLSVAQINALTGLSVGDVYNVTDSGTLTQGNVSVVAGDNVAWNGSVWDKLSSDVDLSNYVTYDDINIYLQQLDAVLQTKQDSLVSGSNIKTINNQSILGSGNITIQGTGGDYLEVISINVPSTLADFYTAYGGSPKIILTNIGYCSISVDTDGQDYFFEIECLYNSKRWALVWSAGDSGISGSTTINSIVGGTTYRKDYLTEENGLTKVEAFTILSQKFNFTIPTSAWTSQTNGVFNAQATITLTDTYLDDGTNVEAFFENVVDSAGVVLVSATQNGSDLELVFYANESKTNAIGGFIKYVY